MLYTFLMDRECATQKSAENCALAAFLVQSGMDTHDLIDLDGGEQQESKMRSRQMKVLAGDYFSSVFFALLAGVGEIDMISAMSSAICEVNSLKVKLYTKLKQVLLSAEDYLKESTQVKMSLFLSFSGLLEKSKQNVWRLLLTELSRCEVVMEEMKHSLSIPEQRLGYAYLHILETGTSEDKEMLRRYTVGNVNGALCLLNTT
ncbi:heptaprenyl diphosphate synthase component 1 [Paenibacillus sp. D2_2]|uniref:heptaprenyl diphosphate synthase component 1 n=1 Tax=Paenibacillus sp. D2_2 TaxID=3073092 RepID=UPI0028162980|nr:heptaprenyl diphosphate synthase component 1 [Paenibacillus sp. D2_2]WMT42684.1 heptaprenyl diphosphate synthase component 1 [Paenibacillus sp. D2_2]